MLKFTTTGTEQNMFLNAETADTSTQKCSNINPKFKTLFSPTHKTQMSS